MGAQPALLDVRPASRCGSTCRTPGPSHAHCAAAGCHRTLASITDFDRHRRDGHCLHPAGLGLVERAGLWASPERHAADAAFVARRAEARSGGLLATPEPPGPSAGTSGHPQPAAIDLDPLEATRA